MPTALQNSKRDPGAVDLGRIRHQGQRAASVVAELPFDFSPLVWFPWELVMCMVRVYVFVCVCACVCGLHECVSGQKAWVRINSPEQMLICAKPQETGRWNFRVPE